MSRRWRYPRTRRGTFSGIIPAQTAASPPAYVPAFAEPSGRSSRLTAARPRRGQFSAIPRQQPQPVIALARRGQVRMLHVRRGKFFVVPPAVVVPTAAPWIPSSVVARRPAARPPRRGRFCAVPLVGVAPPPPVTLPTFSRGRVRVVFTRRGRQWGPPVAQQTPPVAAWAPQFIHSRRPQVTSPRRGRFLPLPCSTAPGPARITSRRVLVPALRRGRYWSIPRGSSPVAPAAYVPKLTRPQRRRHPLVRRASFIEPAWPAHPGTPYTPLTDPVSVVRPNPATAGTRGNAAAASARPNPAEAAT